MQNPDQTTEQTGGPYPWRWRPGQSGNPLGKLSRKLRHAELMASLGADLGGLDLLTAGDRALLSRAVDLLLVHPRDHTERTRSVNTAHRILNGIRGRVRRRPKGPSHAELRDRIRGGR